jgi:tRNA pseudouridine55 synthase
LENAKTIEQLSALANDELYANLMACDKPLEKLPALHLSEQQAKAISYGQDIDIESQKSESDYRLYADGLFLGLGEYGINGKLHPKKLFNLND